MRKRFLITLMVGLALWSCDDATAPDDSPGDGPGPDPAPTGSIEISPMAPRYSAGENARFRVRNFADRMVGYNLCLGWGEIERLEDGRWATVQLAEPLICTAEMIGVPAGEFRDDDTEIPAELSPGAYRFVFALSFVTGDNRDVRREDRTSGAFAIE